MRQLRERRTTRRAAAADLVQVRKIADEDITLLGEELAQLGTDVAGRRLDAETRRDYQRALDAYERRGGDLIATFCGGFASS